MAIIIKTIFKMNLPMITMITQASPWSSRTGNSRALPAISDPHFIEVGIMSGPYFGRPRDFPEGSIIHIVAFSTKGVSPGDEMFPKS